MLRWKLFDLIQLIEQVESLTGSRAVHLTPSFILVIAECTMQGGHKNLTLQQTCKEPAPEFFCGFCERSSWNEKNIKKDWISSKPLLHWGIDFHPFTQQVSAQPEKCLSGSSDPSGDQHWIDAEEGFCPSVGIQTNACCSEGGMTVRNLYLLIDSITCEKPHT